LGLREEKKEQTRRLILDTADELFRSKGYAESRVAEICQRVRVSEKTFFNYFRSKEAVLTELAVEWFHRNGEAIGEPAGDSDSPLAALLADIALRLRVIERDREFLATVVAETGVLRPGGGHEADSPSEQILYELMTRFQEKCEGFRQAQKHGEIRDDVPAEEITGYYNALRNSIVGAWLREEEARPGELEARVMRALDVLLSGLRPRAARPRGELGRTPGVQPR